MPARARTIVDDRLLPPDRGQLLRDRACKEICAAAGRERRDDADRLDRVRLRNRRQPKHRRVNNQHPADSTASLHTFLRIQLFYCFSSCPTTASRDPRHATPRARGAAGSALHASADRQRSPDWSPCRSPAFLPQARARWVAARRTAHNQNAAACRLSMPRSPRRRAPDNRVLNMPQ